MMSGIRLINKKTKNKTFFAGKIDYCFLLYISKMEETYILEIPQKAIVPYLRTLPRLFANVSSDNFDAVFMVWIVQLVKVLTIDDNIQIQNYDLYRSIMNTLNDILFLSKAQLIFHDDYMKGLQEILKKTCSPSKNGILIEEILNEYHMHKSEYDRNRRETMIKLKKDLIQKVWHPMRILKKMETYNLDPIDM